MHILLIDDQSFTRSTTKQVLQQLPCVDLVSEAGSGLEARHAGQIHPPDLVLIDIDMGDMTGLEITRHFRDQKPALPIIALSQAGSRAPDALAAGADAFMRKDTDMVEIIKAVIRAHNRTTSSIHPN